MKFTCNTKPLKDALDLCVIRANISNFYKKSCIIQLGVKDNMLVLNTEADSVYTEVRLRGSIEDFSDTNVFVSSLLLQQLVSTFESSTVSLEFMPDGLLLRTGNSKFTLPKLIDGEELTLVAPTMLDSAESLEVDIDSTSWKFVEDNQMYALAMSFNYPVYTKIWVGADSDSAADSSIGMNPPDNSASGKVIVGDYDRGIFTLSTGNFALGTACLLTDTIISLFTSLPEGAKLRYSTSAKKFLINVVTDSFEYMSEFTPTYESDEDVGDYNSPVLLEALTHGQEYLTLGTAEITKLVNQATLLSNSSEDLIKWDVQDDSLILSDSNVNGKFGLQATGTIVKYSCNFRLDLFSKVLSKYSEDTINVSPRYIEELGVEPDLVGIVIWDKNLTTVITCADKE